LANLSQLDSVEGLEQLIESPKKAARIINTIDSKSLNRKVSKVGAANQGEGLISEIILNEEKRNRHLRKQS